MAGRENANRLKKATRVKGKWVERNAENDATRRSARKAPRRRETT